MNATKEPSRSTNEREKQIESIADNLTKDVSKPPVPVFEIARKRGLTVWIADFGELAATHSGFCDLKNNAIYVNKQDQPNRRAFAASHELGHFLLHREHFERRGERFVFLLRDDDGSDNANVFEAEASYFAKCLLLPRSELEAHLKDNEANILAAAFDVSENVLDERRKEIE